ncbi:glycine-rich domain-containing protein [Burkholderia multivorans]|uniref:glycine-rich domain-containing protein n=1 Tax=Burkholderia multivorans TaxID=87883 RepID=UPI0021BFDD51|nr:hypothetical protein [Burkholderia multivorans]
MDRQTVYAGQVPLETDLLSTNRNVLIAIGKMLGDMLGSSTFATGLACVATSPASMNVQVQPGQLYSLQNLDNTPYSSLPSDTTHQIVKQGIMLDAQSFSCPAPTTAGYSINYLIEANYADVDANPVVLPFYNASNPSQAFNGPGGNGQPSMTTRAGKVILTLKPGVAAATGSQITPAVDSGCVGLWVVTVAYGQSTITSSNISQYAGAPILPTSLLQSLITNNLEYGVDSGPANAVQATFPIAPSSVVDNQQFWVKIKSANTGATTFTPNPGVIGAAPVVGAAHQALQGGELVANGRALFVYRADIASYVLESCTGAPLQTAPATQSQHALQLGQATGRLLRTTVYINSGGTLQSSVDGAAFANASSTFTPLALTTSVDVEVLGGGAGGGGAAPTGANQVSAGGGGGGGGYARKRVMSGFAGVIVTVGAGGTASAGAAGASGGSSSFGSILSATGGVGGSLGNAASNTTNSLNGGSPGGTGSGGTMNSSGGTGQAAFYAAVPVSGKGGASVFGEGAFPVSNSSAGNAAQSYGAGGSGGSLASNAVGAAIGGNGASGLVIVREYA